ncbi:MAG: GGDEF domain-containing protein [Deltaproteobacteria bacterium]
MDGQDLLRELERTISELAAFNEIGKALTGSLDVREVLGTIMQKVSELLRPENWSLLLVDEAANELCFEVAVGAGADHIKGMRVALGEGIAGWVAQHGQPLLVPDVRADSRFASRFDIAAAFETRAALAVPLRCKGRTLGVIEVITGPEGHPFTEGDLRTLSRLADYAAIALDNARNFRRIEELSVLDDHTGLYNARFLYRQLEVELGRARRFDRPLSLAFFDLDRFKTVNDTYGHQHGSALLREVGEVVRATLRGIDVAIRYGGDEFVALLPETDRVQARRAVERLRAAIAERFYLADRGLGVRLTASFGVATFPDDATTGDELMRQADMAMYRVKENGRDGVRQASEPPAVEAKAG